jgi:hypothetical protein
VAGWSSGLLSARNAFICVPASPGAPMSSADDPIIASSPRMGSSAPARALARGPVLWISVPEPLSRLQPGSSDRDHRPLCAALATWTTLQRSQVRLRNPSSRRPTLTLPDQRPTKGGRQTPAPRGLVRDGLLIRRRHGWAPTPARPPGPDPHRAGRILDEQNGPHTPRRDPVGRWRHTARRCASARSGFSS